MRKIIILLLMIALLGTGCSLGENQKSAQGEEQQQKTLTLAHIHGEASPVYGSLEEFGDRLEEQSDGRLSTKTYGEAILGDERVLLELLKTGVIDMAKVSGGVLESFQKEFSVFSLPYIFKDDEHFRRVMASDTVQQMYADLDDAGLRGITHYFAGTRSFYTKNTPIEHPDDLRGLKIRVMNNQTSIQTMDLLGASPTPLPASEVYTGLQQGIIDGAESSPIALTDANHGEVAKAFSFDGHTRIPDFLVMSADTWNKLTEEERDLVLETSRASTESHAENWDQLLEESMKKSEEELGVEFFYPDQEPFRERVQPLIEERKEDPKIKEILDSFAEME